MLRSFLRSLLPSLRPSPVVVGGNRTLLVVGPSNRGPIVIGPSSFLRIAPPPRAAWEEKGWIRLPNSANPTYTGEYQVTDHRTGLRQQYPGRIELVRREPVAYICRPPVEIRAHPKGPCFNLIEHDWFRLHWHRPAKNVDDAILYIERILYEAINRRGSWTS